MRLEDDSDMKIAGQVPKDGHDALEGEVDAFVREKTNGNIERAQKAGKLFAQALTSADQDSTVYFGIGEMDDAVTLRQRRILFSYIVNRVIAELAPNSIVAQAALSSFYEQTRKASEEIYQQINDSLAFSLYIFSYRSAGDMKAAARVFAQLCGKEGDRVFIQYGQELGAFFARFCTETILALEMVH